MSATPVRGRVSIARAATASGLASALTGAALVAGSMIQTAWASEPLLTERCDVLEDLVEAGQLPEAQFERLCAAKDDRAGKSEPKYPGTTYPPKTTPPPTTPPPTTPPPTTPPPTEPPEEPEEPGIELAILEPICDDDVPYLEYVITADEEIEATTVTMTWVNPDGDDVVYENLPLAARVLWAGAVIAEDGSPLDWPGWIQLEDGTWIQGDDGFEWVRPEVEIIFDVNPELSVTVGYPPSEPDCDANPPQNGPPPEELPETGGSQSALLAGMGALLLAAGASLALFGRRLARSRT